ncbi:MAG: flagellar biosynthesis protein FlhB [Candidatus Zixiibacteriota bacterium]
MAEDADKRYEPTQHHLEQARKKGDIPKSNDFIGIMTLIISLSLIFTTWKFVVNDVQRLFSDVLKLADPLQSFGLLGKTFLKWLMIYTMPVLLASILGHIAQKAIVFSTEAIQPKFDRINPAKNLKNLFSIETLVTAIKALVSMSILVGVIMIAVRKMASMMVGASIDLAPFVKASVVSIIPIVLWLAAMSFGDLVFTRLRHKHKHKMTVQEMKEELKQTEGDPLIKSKQRAFRNKILSGSMQQDVEEATVVITNPVHLAIALKYDPEEFPAPLVMAKGARKMAEKIKKIAKENKVPIIENPPVAQLLYRFVEVGDAVPPKYYKVVAEILAYIMTRKAASNAA